MVTINDIFQFGALVGKVEVDLLNKDDDNYNRQVLHSEKVNNMDNMDIMVIMVNIDSMVNMATMVNMDNMYNCCNEIPLGIHSTSLS